MATGPRGAGRHGSVYGMYVSASKFSFQCTFPHVTQKPYHFGCYRWLLPTFEIQSTSPSLNCLAAVALPLQTQHEPLLYSVLTMQRLRALLTRLDAKDTNSSCVSETKGDIGYTANGQRHVLGSVAKHKAKVYKPNECCITTNVTYANQPTFARRRATG